MTRSPSTSETGGERRTLFISHSLRCMFCIFAYSNRDDYGFVSFRYKVDAYEAVEHGNDDPAFPKVDLCFGGRRSFCKEKYSDLGKE